MDGLFFYRCFRVSKYMTRSILYVLESGFFFFYRKPHDNISYPRSIILRFYFCF